METAFLPTCDSCARMCIAQTNECDTLLIYTVYLSVQMYPDVSRRAACKSQEVSTDTLQKGPNTAVSAARCVLG